MADQVEGSCSNNLAHDGYEGHEGAELLHNDVNVGEDVMAIDGVENFGNVDFNGLNPDVMREFHFENLQVAYELYNEYGKLKGFSVRKHKIGRNQKNDVVWQSFVCSKHGYRDKKHINKDSWQREPRPLTRCGCKAEMRVHVDGVSGRWHVTLFEDDHNHELVSQKFVGLLRSHRRMTKDDIGQMNNMRNVGISTPKIYGSFASQCGGFHMVGFQSKEMYNQIDKQRRMQVGDANAAISYLRSLADADPLMYWRHTVDDVGQLRHLFWCDGTSQVDYKVFGDVLAFDATYCKNKYKCPVVILSGVNHHLQTIVFGCAFVSDETEETYIWILEQFLEAMKVKCPKSVITDGDMAMRNAITRVFPVAHHRLCAWHLLRNATANVGNPKFTQGFKKCMLGDYEVHEFERKWQSILEEFGVMENSWVQDLTEKKLMWATAHMRGKFFAGLRTTSRCEALHSQLGKYVGSRERLSEFLPHFQRCLDYIRNNEIQADFKSFNGEPVMQTQLVGLERSAAKVYTREIFYIFRSLLWKATTVKVVGFKQTATSQIFIVSKYCNATSKWHVSHYPDATEFRCSCRRMESFGMPCVHIIVVMVYLDINDLPNTVVIDRWSKHAKEGVEREYPTGCLVGDTAYMYRYGALLHSCRRMCSLACRRIEDYNELREKLAAETTNLEIMNATEECILDGGTQCYVPNVRDPALVRSKGCGPKRPDMSSQSMQREKRRLQRCSRCRGVGHNRRKCPFYAEHADISGYGFWDSDDEDSRDDEQAEDEGEDDIMDPADDGVDGDMDLDDDDGDDEDQEEDNDVVQEREDEQELVSRYSNSVAMV